MNKFENKPEKDDGFVEYKWRLINLSPERLEQLATQMRYRLTEGNGEAIYEIGLKDNGFPEGVTEDEMTESDINLRKIAEKIDAYVKQISEKKIGNKFFREYLIREKPVNNNYIDLSIVVAGNVDAAKSSTIGCLISGVLDNGRGLSRTQVFNYVHEVESGRTSSVGHQIMGFDGEGKVVNYGGVKKLSWPEIVKNSSKVITFYDLCGHEKYLRTTIYGFSSSSPDYAMIMVGANMGITHMTKEHIALCLTYKIPFFIVYTKIDITPEDVFKETKKNVKKLLSAGGCRKIILEMKDNEGVILGAKNVVGGSVVPVMEISNVSGYNLDLLRSFLNILQKRINYKKYEGDDVEFTVDAKYCVTGVGTVVAGVMHKGVVKVGDNVLIGPDGLGQYMRTQIRSIHEKRVNVGEAKAGSYVCFGLRKVSKGWIRRGMVILGNLQHTSIVWQFDADVSINASNLTTIRVGYEPNIHVNNISQVCVVMDIGGKDCLRAGEKANVRFCFKYFPQYLREGSRIVFRENRVRGVGIIRKIVGGNKPQFVKKLKNN